MPPTSMRRLSILENLPVPSDPLHCFAAKQLGIIRRGVVRVSVEKLR